MQTHLNDTCGISVSIPKTFNYDNPLNEIADIARNLAYTEHGIMFTTGHLELRYFLTDTCLLRLLREMLTEITLWRGIHSNEKK